jgi:D-glycero-D-manno-heptose 1,7-bisphosphate phosphatase
MKPQKNKLELVLMSGIPGCGKSTFSERLLPYHYPVNLDSIHEFINPQAAFSFSNVRLSREIEDSMIADRLRQKTSVVVDNTNITREKRRKYLEFARDYHAEFISVYFKPNLEQALLQNSQRERKVPNSTIRYMEKHYQMPEFSEGFTKIIEASNPIGLTGTKTAIFLDRDGVIFEGMRDGKSNFVNNPSDISYVPNAIGGLREMQSKGYKLFIVSNQSGVALNIMKEETLDAINNKMSDDLKKEGVKLSGIYCCTHSSRGNCKCRKPATGLLIGAAREHDIDITRAYMIGDMTSDIEVGSRVLATTILVKTGFGGSDNKYKVTPDYIANNLLDASRFIV